VVQYVEFVSYSTESKWLYETAVDPTHRSPVCEQTLGGTKPGTKPVFNRCRSHGTARGVAGASVSAARRAKAHHDTWSPVL